MSYFRIAIVGLALRFSMDLCAQGIQPETVEEMVFVDIKSNNTTRAEHLIRGGVNVNSRDQNGATLMMWAVLKTDLAFVARLAALGADPRLKGVIYMNDEKTAYYGSAMSIAVAENKIELVKYLVEDLKVPLDEKEFEPQMAREVGWTAVEWAAHFGNKPMLDYLVGKGATLNEGILTGGLRQLNKQEYNEAIGWTQEMLKLFDHRQLTDSIQAIVHFIIGDAYFELGDRDMAGIELEKSAAFVEAFPKVHPYHLMIYNTCAANFCAQGNNEKALGIYLKLLESKTLLEDKKQKGIYLSGNYSVELHKMLANTYERLKVFDKAEDYYQKALDLSRQTKPFNNIGTAEILTEFGFFKVTRKEYTKALEFFTLALSEVEGFKPEGAQKGLAKAYAKMGQFDKAEQTLHQLVTTTVAKYGEGSGPHLSILLNDYARLYIDSRNLLKEVPYLAAYFHYQLKNMNSMKEPLDQRKVQAIKNDYVKNFDFFYLLAALSQDTDTTLTTTLCNYQLAVAKLFDDNKQGKHHGTSQGLTWQQKRNSLSKNDANIEIIRSPSFDGSSPEYYALTVSKQIGSPFIIPLYDSTAATSDVFKMYDRFSKLTQREGLQQQSVVKKLEGVKKIKVAFKAEKKPNLKTLYSLFTRKYFLDGVSSKIIQED